jgi:hypothetical protein
MALSGTYCQLATCLNPLYHIGLIKVDGILSLPTFSENIYSIKTVT